MAEVDIFEGLSDEEILSGFGDEPEATPEEPTEEPKEEVTEEPEEQADQPAEEESVEVTEEQTEEQPVEEAQPSDQTFTLKHLGETKDYSRDEIIPLAQKGLDYDRIRTERDSLKAEKASLQEHEDFLKELAELAGSTIDDLMVDTKARLVVQDEKKKGNDISFEQARYRVQTDMKAKKAQAPVVSKREESFQWFKRNFPDVAAEDIPKEVWMEFGDGSQVDLSVAYQKYVSNSELKKTQDELKQLQEKFKTLEQNQKNKQRTTGSRRSNGSPPIDHDLDGWGEY